MWRRASTSRRWSCELNAATQREWRWLRCNLHHLAAAFAIATAVAIAFAGGAAVPLAVPALLLIALVADGIARPGSSVFYPTIRHAPRAGDAVALTFDDGPDPIMTPRVLDELAAAGAHATFFVVGHKLAAEPALARRIAAEGHALGNHSWRHSRWQNFFTTRAHLAEIDRCEAAIAAVKQVPRQLLYRPPVGLKSGELARAAWQRGATIIAWSLHARDTHGADAETIARRVLARVRAGDIVLLHDGHDLPGRSRPHCPEAVRLILQGLARRGLRCVTVPELLAESGCMPQALPAARPL
jgi:peptidoglycan/xylan/chitin deacetylase (PgdA/CDA1 family)